MIGRQEFMEEIKNLNAKYDATYKEFKMGFDEFNKRLDALAEIAMQK